MKATRRTQPYRKGKARPPGASLDAMLRGRTAHGHNPQDAKRALAKRLHRRLRSEAVRKRRHNRA